MAKVCGWCDVSERVRGVSVAMAWRKYAHNLRRCQPQQEVAESSPRKQKYHVQSKSQHSCEKIYNEDSEDTWVAEGSPDHST